MRGLWIAAIFALLLSTPAFNPAHAQGAIQQAGPVVSFHVPTWYGNGLLGDAGTPATPATSSLGLFNGSQCPFGVSSQTGPGQSLTPYSQFSICQTLTTSTLTFAGLNGAATPSVFFNVGGTLYPFPGPGSGNVLGPPSSVSGDTACFNTTTGTLLKDCGQPAPVSVTVYGAKCDGTTDDTTAINNALAANAAVILPTTACYSATGITVPYGHRLTGITFSAAPDVLATGSEILCPNTLAVCLHVGNGSANEPSIVDHVTIVGQSGAPSSGTDGILIDGGSNVIIEDVGVSNFDHLYHWKGYPQTGPGISGFMDRNFGTKAQTAYIWNDGWPELHVTNSRMGSTGTGDYTTGEYILISGGFGGSSGGPNTFVVEDDQFNQGTAGPAWGIKFANCTSPCVPSVDGTLWKFTDNHWENMTSGWITTDSSWNYIDRMMVEQNSINTPSVPCLVLNSATEIAESSFVGNQFLCSTFTLNPSTATNNMSWVSFVANDFLHAFTLTAPMTGSTVSFLGNQFRGTTTFSGEYGALSLTGDQYFSVPTFSATGTVSILEPQYPSSALYGCLDCENIWTMAQIVGTNTTTEPLILNGPTGVSRYVDDETAGVQRWVSGASASTESGGNTGSDYFIDRYNDSGVKIDTPLEIFRTNGLAEFADSLSVGGELVVETGLNMGDSPTNVGTLLCSATAPTITSAGSAPTVPDANGTCSFTVNVGTGGSASAIVLAMPTATTGWTCVAADVTTQSTSVFLQKQTASSATAATITNYNTAGAATAFAASDLVRISCHAD